MKGDVIVKLSFKKRIVIISFAVMILMLMACGRETGIQPSNADIPDKITISGLEDEVIEVSLDDIKELEKINQDVVSISSSGEENEMNVTGGLLEELLQKHGKTQKNLLGIRVVAIDGYSIEIPNEVLEHRDILLVYEIEGEPLFEDSQPIRVVVPDERAMYWVKSLDEIEILTNEEGQTDSEFVNKITIFDSTLSNLEETDYEGVDKAIKIEELLTNCASDDLDGKVFIKAADGLEKGEDNKIFRDAYIKTTGEDAPMILSPDMPKGMTVKNILWFSIGETSFISMDSALGNFDAIDSDGIKGIAIEDIFDDIKLLKGDTYTFTGIDGYSVDINVEDLNSGILYKMGDGKTVIQFPELEKSTTVKELLSIEVK